MVEHHSDKVAVSGSSLDVTTKFYLFTNGTVAEDVQRLRSAKPAMKTHYFPVPQIIPS